MYKNIDRVMGRRNINTWTSAAFGSPVRVWAVVGRPPRSTQNYHHLRPAASGAINHRRGVIQAAGHVTHTFIGTWRPLIQTIYSDPLYKCRKNRHLNLISCNFVVFCSERIFIVRDFWNTVILNVSIHIVI